METMVVQRHRVAATITVQALAMTTMTTVALVMETMVVQKHQGAATITVQVLVTTTMTMQVLILTVVTIIAMMHLHQITMDQEQAIIQIRTIIIIMRQVMAITMVIIMTPVRMTMLITMLVKIKRAIKTTLQVVIMPLPMIKIMLHPSQRFQHNLWHLQNQIRS